MIINKAKQILIFISCMIQIDLYSQDVDFKIKLKVKSEVYNKFPGFIDVFSSQKGDYKNFMDLFCDENVTVIDDELSLTNKNYGKRLNVVNYQMILRDRGGYLDDQEWCGMPFYVGEPSFISNDTGEIEIVVKHALRFTDTNNVKFIDTQILIFRYTFHRKESTDENGKINSYSFKIKQIKLHPKYIRPKSHPSKTFEIRIKK